MALSILLLISVLIPVFCGYCLISFIFTKNKLDIVLNLALSYGMGMGILTIWMFIIGISGLELNFANTTFPLVCFSFIFLLIAKHSTPLSENIQTPKDIVTTPKPSIMLISFNSFLIIFITVNILQIFWGAISWPIDSWDAFATIAFKAKIFFYEKSIPSLKILPHPTYPLHTSLAETWTAINIGRWSDQYIKIIFPCTFLSFLIVQYKFLKNYTDTTWSLLGCVLLISSNLAFYHATISYRDLFLMYYNCITIMMLILWSSSKKTSFLITAAFFAGFASFTKLEGSSFIVIYIILFIMISFFNKTSFKENIKNTLALLIPSLTICLSFHIYKFFTNNLIDGTADCDKTALVLGLGQLLKLPKVIHAFYLNMFLSGNWNIVWMIACVSILLWDYKKKNREAFLVLVSIFLFIGLYSAIALFTSNYPWIAGDKRVTTLSRLILHFYPLAPILIILINHLNFSSDRLDTSSINPKKQALNK